MKSLTDMSANERLDFVEQLFWAVRENDRLESVAFGVVDSLSSGDVVHGPWRPEDCALVLGRWHEERLLYLFRGNEDGRSSPELPHEDASAVLAQPGLWDALSDSPTGGFWLEVTNKGLSWTEDQWRAAVADLAG